MSNLDQNMSRAERKKAAHNTNSGSLFKTIMKFILGAIVLAAVVVGGVSAYWIVTAPEITEADLYGTLGSDVVDKDGNEVYSFGEQERDFIAPEEIPSVLEEAVLAIEDQRFYDHIGVDPIRIGGAVVANFREGFGSEGGSTITQQLIKMSVFSTTGEDQTLKRKVQEAWLALQVEQEYSKEQILTLYINKVYMSDNVYGMGTASEHYYGKSASELELHEAALLAGMPQAPNSYNPYDFPEQAKSRRDTVIYAMLDKGTIDEATAEDAYDVPIEEGLIERELGSEDQLVLDAYIKQVLEEVQTKTDLDPYTAGLTIYTNLDTEAQHFLYDVLNSDQYINYPDEDFQAGISVLDVETGKVLALGGGRNSEGQLTYNRATELDRSVGSTIKPLTVYGPAIEYEQYSTYHQLVDEPYEYPTGGAVQNYDRRYVGNLSMREALVDSRNVPTMKLFEDVGLDRAEEFVDGLGIHEPNNGEGLYWSNGLGGEITPMQLSASYAAFGNGGQYTDPYTVETIERQDGQTIDLTPETTQAMSDYTAYMVTDMLKDAGESYNYATHLTGLVHTAKTGTTNYSQDEHAQYGIPSGYFPDRWTAGYTTEHSVAVWTGYDYRHEQGNYMSFDEPSGYVALNIFGVVLDHMSQKTETGDWQAPESVVERSVIDGSNPPVLAPAGHSNAITELFVRGNEPDPSLTPVPEEDPDEKEDEDNDELAAPSGLTAFYDEEGDTVQVQWDAYPGENVSYELTIDGQTVDTAETSYVYDSPPAGSNITLSLTAIVGGENSPTTTIALTIPGSAEEDTSEEDTSEEDTTSEEESTEEEETTSEDDTSEDTTEDTESEDTSTEDTTTDTQPPQPEDTSPPESDTSPPDEEDAQAESEDTEED